MFRTIKDAISAFYEEKNAGIKINQDIKGEISMKKMLGNLQLFFLWLWQQAHWPAAERAKIRKKIR